MKFKPYEEYKKVDLPWIDKIPSHWKMKKIKYIFSERNERGKEREPLLVASQKYGVILKSMYETRTVEAQRNLESLKYVNRGDFVISLRSFQGGIEHAYYSGIISPTYTIMIPKEEIRRRYFKHLAKSYNFIKLLQTCVTGIREGQNIDYNKLRSQKMFLPPKEEQDKIADFLDYNLAKIDKFVELTERQIELLKEQREVIINHAVTKGIDKTVEYKDSGIDWIGEIPEHWEVTRLKYILKNQTEKDRVLKDNQVYIGLANIESKTGNIIGIDNDIKIQSDSPKFKEGDILFGKLRPYLSKVAIARNDGLCSGEILVLRKRTSIVFKKYIFYRLLSYNFISIVNSSTYGSKMPRAEWSFIGSLKITIPPKKEQEEIVAYIEKETNKIDRTIEVYKNHIELIKEYRTSLIASAVTGKIDVRDF